MPKNRPRWSVYILRCRDGSLYVGITNDLERRVAAHNAGKGGAYTRSHRPVTLVFSEACASKGAALSREAEIKSWTKKKKERFVRGR